MVRRRAGRGSRTGQTLQATTVVFQTAGEPEVLTTRVVPVPPPGPGEVRLAHSAIGVNYLDVYIRRGLIPLASPGQPLGVEAAGVVLDIGPDVTELKPGDRVAYAMLPTGSYATHRNVPASQLVRVPAHIDDDTAAAVLLKGLTAEYLLHRLHPLRPRETVLVHAAAGGLGSIVVQWARALGAVVIGTVSSEEKAQEARQHGCHHVVVTSDYNFSSGVLSATGGRGVDLIVDGLGGARRAGQPRFAGHCSATGSASGRRADALPPISADALIEKSATFSRPVLFHYTADPHALPRWQAGCGRCSPRGRYVRRSVGAIRCRRRGGAPGTGVARHARLADPDPVSAR